MELKIIKSKRRSMAIEIKDDGVYVRVPYWATNSDINAFITKNKKWIETHVAEHQSKKSLTDDVEPLTFEEIEALADKALKVIPERVKYYAPIVGVTYGRITIRNQRSRWGSCSSKGNLNFNCLLMLAPEKVIDSVVVHELCHRIEMNHSSRFYDEVLRVYPDYFECHKWLKENGPLLMARMEKGTLSK